MERRATLASALIVAGLSAFAPQAQAAFPGANGKLVFTSDPSGSDLEVYSMNTDGSAQTDLSNNANSDSEPAWSPDGSKIAFSTDRDLNDEIYVMAIGGGAPMNLTNSAAASDTSPAWSPDGQKLAFTRDDGSFNLEIWTMSATGSGQTNLTNDSALDTSPAWSPDGQKIAFTTTRDGNAEVYVMATNGGSPTNLTGNPATDSAPDWSPDGKKLVFSSRRDGNAEIYVMNANGSGQARLTNDSAGDLSPAFSPDGKKIAFRSNRDGSGYEIYVMNADGSGQARLTSNSWLDIDPDWQPLPAEGYPRPKGATPLLVSLVPAYEPCVSANSSHGLPLAAPSCSPPDQASSFLTVGTPDANGKPANSTASLRADVIPGDASTTADEADVRLAFIATDVREGDNLSDYGGELQPTVALRITDKFNGYGSQAATASDLEFPFTVPCAGTTDTTVGSTCASTTAADAVTPGAIVEGRRAIWELGQVRVNDGGADGLASTAGNTVFLTEGVFVP